MGCDIHLITEIRRNGKWEYVKEKPDALCTRNYTTFSILADVRNSFHHTGFLPKGLPDDLSGIQFQFESERQNIEKRYETGTERKIKLPNGTYISYYDDRVKKTVDTKEEAEKYGSYTHIGENYLVVDASLVGGECVDVPFKEIYSKEEFFKKYEDEYNEIAKDYGYYKVDFDSPDYHTHSWLTLKELKDYDLSDYTKTRVKIPKTFYDKFIEFGGKLPEEMSVIEEFDPSDIREAIQMAFNPEIIVVYNDNSDDIKTENLPLVKGILELTEISKKYNVSPEDIRIVFAFDN